MYDKCNKKKRIPHSSISTNSLSQLDEQACTSTAQTNTFFEESFQNVSRYLQEPEVANTQESDPNELNDSTPEKNTKRKANQKSSIN